MRDDHTDDEQATVTPRMHPETRVDCRELGQTVAERVDAGSMRSPSFDGLRRTPRLGDAERK